MVSEEVWKRAVDVAQIVSALATFATVVVATRLWARQFNPRLRATIRDVVLISGRRKENYVSIAVTNVGLTQVIVTGLGYRPHRWSKMRFFQIHDYENPLSAKIPLKLQPGDSTQYLFTPDEWLDAMSEQLHRSYVESAWVRLLWKRGFRAQVWTSTDVVFNARPAGELIERLHASLLERIIRPPEAGAE